MKRLYTEVRSREREQARASGAAESDAESAGSEADDLSETGSAGAEDRPIDEDAHADQNEDVDEDESDDVGESPDAQHRDAQVLQPDAGPAAEQEQGGPGAQLGADLVMAGEFQGVPDDIGAIIEELARRRVADEWPPLIMPKPCWILETRGTECV